MVPRTWSWPLVVPSKGCSCLLAAMEKVPDLAPLGSAGEARPGSAQVRVPIYQAGGAERGICQAVEGRYARGVEAGQVRLLLSRLLRLAGAGGGQLGPKLVGGVEVGGEKVHVAGSVRW